MVIGAYEMKIGIVSDQTGMSIHTIRYYEKQGLVKKPVKDASGHRSYTLKDVDVLNWISCMKNSGMSLNTIKRYTEAFYQGNDLECIAFLEEHLNHLYKQQQDIEHYIEVTENKINRFKNA